MTPEQEDAHWALLGKPLMREWRIYVHNRIGAMAASYIRWAAAVRSHGAQLTSASWVARGCVVNDVLYPYTFGVPDFEGEYDD